MREGRGANLRLRIAALMSAQIMWASRRIEAFPHPRPLSLPIPEGRGVKKWRLLKLRGARIADGEGDRGEDDPGALRESDGAHAVDVER